MISTADGSAASSTMSLMTSSLRTGLRQRRTRHIQISHRKDFLLQYNFLIIQEILKLPVKYKEILLLYYYQDLLTADIAKILNIPYYIDLVNKEIVSFEAFCKLNNLEDRTRKNKL